MNSFYKWWILILGLQWFFLGLCSTNIKAANPHANLCYEALTSIVGLVVAIVLTRIWGCRPLLTFSHCWSALMLIVQSLGLYFDRPDVTLFGHFATNISLKADLGLILFVICCSNPLLNYREKICFVTSRLLELYAMRIFYDFFHVSTFFLKIVNTQNESNLSSYMYIYHL